MAKIHSSATSARRNTPSPQAYRRAVGRRIRQLRERREIRQFDLARALGIHPDTLGRYERGLTPLPVDLLPTLTRQLGVDAARLLGLAPGGAGAPGEGRG